MNATTAILAALPTHTVVSYVWDDGFTSQRYAWKLNADGRWFGAYRTPAGSRCTAGIMTTAQLARAADGAPSLVIRDGSPTSGKYPTPRS